MELAPFVWVLVFFFFLVEDHCVLLQMFANEQTRVICGPHLRSTEICPVTWPVSFGQSLCSPHQMSSQGYKPCIWRSLQSWGEERWKRDNWRESRTESSRSLA